MDRLTYLDIVRAEEEEEAEDTALLSSSRLLTTTTTTTTPPANDPLETDTASSAPGSVDHPPILKAAQRASLEQREQWEQSLLERAEPGNKVGARLEQNLQPAADVAGEMAQPPADVARPHVPANWQELDPRAYQPRPFGPMETDPDWPGNEEADEPPTPLAGLSIRQVDARGGLAIAPPSGHPVPEPEDVCWLCEDEAECYDPSGQAWCSLCLEASGKSMGWQDLVDLLPAAWQRDEESHRHLAVYAAAHYHGAHRPRIALRWSQPPFHQTLQGADLFRAFAAWLAAPERWKQREAERQLERLVEHQGLGV